MGVGAKNANINNNYILSMLVIKCLYFQDKPVLIPERQKEKKMPHVPEFVRNVMGSSAGAGSGEFHVYRHLRRKEYARQKFIQEKGEKVCYLILSNILATIKCFFP